MMGSRLTHVHTSHTPVRASLPHVLSCTDIQPMKKGPMLMVGV